MKNFDPLAMIGVLTRLDSRASGVWVGHIATKEKIEQIANTPWHDPALDRYTNKQRMKEVGASTMNLTAFISESLFTALANSLEDFWIDVRVETGFKYDIWKSPLRPDYLHAAKTVRSIANVVKHNRSMIDKSSSAHAKFLVEDAGFPDLQHLKTLFLENDPLLKTADMNYFIYLYCHDLLKHITKMSYPLLEVPEPRRRALITSHLVPSVLKLNAM